MSFVWHRNHIVRLDRNLFTDYERFLDKGIKGKTQNIGYLPVDSFIANYSNSLKVKLYRESPDAVSIDRVEDI